jgi:hypothetical protein
LVELLAIEAQTANAFFREDMPLPRLLHVHVPFRDTAEPEYIIASKDMMDYAVRIKKYEAANENFLSREELVAHLKKQRSVWFKEEEARKASKGVEKPKA